MIKLKSLLTEGGNLFPDAVGIKQSEVSATVSKIETVVLKELGLIGIGTDCFILGSAGKKSKDELSGDLDIGVSMDQLASANELKLSEVLDWLIKKLTDMGYDAKPLRGFSQVSIAFPIEGRVTDEPVQVDFMLSNNINWSRFIYNSPDYSKGESKYKGAYRNFLLSAVISGYEYEVLKKSEKGVPIEVRKYSMRFDRGIYQLTKSFAGKDGGIVKAGKTVSGTEKFLTQTPEEVVDFFLGKEYTIEDISSFEKLYDIVFNKPSKVSGAKDLIRKLFIQSLTKAKLPIPEII